MESPLRSPSHKGHKKSKSAGVLKSIVKPSSRTPSPKKRAAFAGDNGGNAFTDRLQLFSSKQQQPQNVSPSRQQPLGALSNANNSPTRSTKRSPQKTLSLDLWNDDADEVLSPAESALLTPTTKPKGYFLPKEKENTTPPSNRPSPRPTTADGYTPIWAQFTSQPDAELARLRGQGNHVTSPTDTKAEHEKYAPPGFGAGSPQRKPVGVVNKELPPAPTPTIASRPVKHTRQESAPPCTTNSPQKKSKVLAAVAKLQGKKTESAKPAQEEGCLEGAELEKAFEDVLESRNIPEHRRPNMRTLDDKIKREFIRTNNDVFDSVSSRDNVKPGRKSVDERQSRSREGHSETEDEGTSTKRSRSKGSTFSWSKRSRSNSRPRSIMSLKNLSSSSLNSNAGQKQKDTQPEKAAGSCSTTKPSEFVEYLKNQQALQKVEVGKLHKLRLLLRNETVDWVASFIELSGMSALLDLLRKIMDVEWREEHEDLLLHEVLLCLKGLCTTEAALKRLADVSGTLFPALIDMLYDEERKGPSEFNTRGVITTLLFAHLAAARPEQRLGRAQEALLYLSDRKPAEEERPPGFIVAMTTSRPYQSWCKEVSGVAKEVFWIFLHHLNVVEPAHIEDVKRQTSYFNRHFPKERPPVPAAPYIGGVEWDATNYLASHLDLMNGIIACLPTRSDRNGLRDELKASGFEKVMGDKLRLCKEKFYGCVHDGLRTWTAAAEEDLWSAVDVRVGPPKPESPKKGGHASPKKEAPPPQIDLPQMDLGVNKAAAEDGWL